MFRSLSNPVHRLRLAIIALPTLLAVGTLGYTLLGMHPFDAFYMTLITISTVGYAEIGGNLGFAGRLFTTGLIGCGIFLVAFTTASFIESIVEGGLVSYFGRRRVAQQISELKDHWIICGFGRMGAMVVNDMRNSQQPIPLVVIDRDRERLNDCHELEIPYLDGDATDEETLERAGIERAYGLVSVVASDAENVFICLTAREMKADLVIIARALEERSEVKLRRAGADKVVSPYIVGGHRLAQAVLQPAVAEFLEFAAGHDLSLELQQALIKKGSSLIGLELRNSGLRSELDLIVLAIRRADGTQLFNPNATTVLNEGDTLIAMGPSKCLVTLQERVAGRGA